MKVMIPFPISLEGEFVIVGDAYSRRMRSCKKCSNIRSNREAFSYAEKLNKRHVLPT